MRTHAINIRLLAILAIATAALALAIFFPTGSGGGSTATASPGGLDSHGGHHCWTSCGQYGLNRGDYHCHVKSRECRRANRRHARHGH